MNQQERAAAERLQVELRGFWDHSIVHRIEIGDNLHDAISEYRDSLPSQHLPSGEGKFMRRTIYGSRSKEKDKRDDAQLAAEEWDELLTAKYMADSGGQTDSPADKSKAKVRIPRNPAILRLIQEINRRKATESEQKPIALELADGDETKAESNLRQVRRFKHLLY